MHNLTDPEIVTYDRAELTEACVFTTVISKT